MQSDVPVSPSDATEFAACLSRWLDEQDALPLYLSGLPAEKDGLLALHGIATGDAGNLLSRAEQNGLDSLGFVVESNAELPDSEAARKLPLGAVAPVAGIEVDTQKLVDYTEEIAQVRQQLAQQMGQAGDESSQAYPIGFQ